MRPYRRFHSGVSQVGHYLGTDGQLFTGFLLEPSHGVMMKALRRYELPEGAGLLHTTLSLPNGQTLTDT